MNRYEALKQVKGLQERLAQFRAKGYSLDPRARATTWGILKNDVEAFAERAFGVGSDDRGRIWQALNRNIVSVFLDDEVRGPPSMRHLEENYLGPLETSLELVAYRLEHNQVTLNGYELIRIPRWRYLVYMKVCSLRNGIAKAPSKAFGFAKQYSTAILVTAIGGVLAALILAGLAWVFGWPGWLP